jgi:hypothetical protein
MQRPHLGVTRTACPATFRSEPSQTGLSTRPPVIGVKQKAMSRHLTTEYTYLYDLLRAFVSLAAWSTCPSRPPTGQSADVGRERPSEQLTCENST